MNKSTELTALTVLALLVTIVCFAYKLGQQSMTTVDFGGSFPIETACYNAGFIRPTDENN